MGDTKCPGCGKYKKPEYDTCFNCAPRCECGNIITNPHERDMCYDCFMDECEDERRRKMENAEVESDDGVEEPWDEEIYSDDE